jgi:hypothetical protein
MSTRMGLVAKAHERDATPSLVSCGSIGGTLINELLSPVAQKTGEPRRR